MNKNQDYSKPCRCGSGHPYENCCWIDDLLNERADFKQRYAERLELLVDKHPNLPEQELQAVLDKAAEDMAREAEKMFIGLSWDQVNRMVYKGIEASPDVVTLNLDLPPAAFLSAPIAQNALYFLKSLAEQEPLKGTAKGNLPVAFVRQIFDKIHRTDFWGDWQIRSEEDTAEVSTLRHVLRMCGWIKIRHNKFSLTQKGSAVLKQGMTAAHFEHLLFIFTRKFPWGYQDRYPDHWEIQDDWLLSLYFLHKKAGEFIEDREFFRNFFRLYPDMIFDDYRGEARTFDEVARCYSVRFLDRFCAYFGFVETKKSKHKSWFERKTYVKTSRLFKDFFEWQVVEQMEDRKKKPRKGSEERGDDQDELDAVLNEVFKKHGLSDAKVNWASEVIEVEFSKDEIRLILDETFADNDMMERLEACLEDHEGEKETEADTYVVCFSPAELDDLIGFVAAEANHARNKRLEDRLDDLYDKLEKALDAGLPKVH